MFRWQCHAQNRTYSFPLLGNRALASDIKQLPILWLILCSSTMHESAQFISEACRDCPFPSLPWEGIQRTQTFMFQKQPRIMRYVSLTHLIMPHLENEFHVFYCLDDWFLIVPFSSSLVAFLGLLLHGFSPSWFPKIGRSLL